MRLFTAIEIDEAARATVAKEQARIASALGDRAGGLRFVKPQNLHLTLVFIGEVGEDRSDALTACMRVGLRQPRFRAVLGELGVFPLRGAPRVLWLGLIEGMRDTIALHHEVAERLALAEDGTGGGVFHPHLTLARWKDRRPSARQVLAAGWRRGPVNVEVGAVTLFQSRLASAGPAYTSLAQAHLRCP